MSKSDLLIGRVSIDNHFYHVTTSTYKRAPIFFNFNNARTLIINMRKLEQENQITNYAFVVMPDHLHWLLQLQKDRNLSQVMKLLKARVSREINRTSTNPRRIWQHGFYDHCIRSDESLITTARYIVANPLRANIVKNIGNYPWWDAIWL